MNYRLIESESTTLSVRDRCRIAGVSPSAFYQWQARPEGDNSDEQLVGVIRQVLETFPGYGYRRVTRELKKGGLIVNKKRVQRVMQAHGLVRRRRRRFVRTTDSNHRLPVYPNLIKDMVIDKPDQVWAADLTYVRLVRGFVYLAVILDLFSRKVLGWALAGSMKTGLVLEALEMALRHRPVGEGVFHHSDRGSQYASEEYVAKLRDHGFIISMSRKGNPYDNAKLESFMKTIKVEEVYLNEYQSEAEARDNIGHFIESIYNSKRLHSALGYCSPVEFEAIFHSQKVA
jgi:putative transposase